MLVTKKYRFTREKQNGTHWSGRKAGIVTLRSYSVCTKSSSWRKGDGHHHGQRGEAFSLRGSQEPKSKQVLCCAGSSTLSHAEPL